MIQISPGDLVGVRANNRYYYALVLDRVRLFGGNWVFAFHRTSSDLLDASDILAGPAAGGFHSFVDFIWAKRDERLVRLARKQPTTAFLGPGFLKHGFSYHGGPARWTILDMSFNEERKVPRLSPKEAKFPDYVRIDDAIMIEKIEARWTPEQDP